MPVGCVTSVLSSRCVTTLTIKIIARAALLSVMCFHREDYLTAGGTEAGWRKPRPLDINQVLVKAAVKRDGLVQFPVTHDITPANLGSCITVIQELIKAGNQVMIHSRPRRMCVEKLMSVFADNKSSVVFR